MVKNMVKVEKFTKGKVQEGYWKNGNMNGKGR